MGVVIGIEVPLINLNREERAACVVEELAKPLLRSRFLRAEGVDLASQVARRATPRPSRGRDRSSIPAPLTFPRLMADG